MKALPVKQAELLKQFNRVSRADQDLTLIVSHRAAGRPWTTTQKRCLAILADEAVKAATPVSQPTARKAKP